MLTGMQWSRRGFLRIGAVSTATGIAGCEQFIGGSQNSCSGRLTPDDPISVPDGQVRVGSAQYYREIRQALMALRQPWAGTASHASDQMVSRLREELVDLLRPGIADLLPGPVGEMKTLLEQVVATFEILQEQQQSFERELVRSEWKALQRGDIRPYYQRVGLSYSDIVDRGRPYYPLFTVLINDLEAVENELSKPFRTEGLEPARSELRSDAAQIRSLLRLYILPRMDFQSCSAKALVQTLVGLNIISQTIPNNTQSTEDTATPTSTPPPSQRGAWPMFRFDAANTGFTPDERGPQSTPEVQWRTQLEDLANTEVSGDLYWYISPTYQNETVYMGALTEGVHAFSASKGSRIWHRPIEEMVVSTPTPVAGQVVVGTWQDASSIERGTVYALDRDTGEVRWDVETEPVLGSPSVVQNTVYIRTMSGVRALNADRGSEQWHKALESAAPSVAVANGLVFARTKQKLHALDANDGAKTWSSDVGPPASAHPLVVGDDTVFTLRTEPHSVRAVDIEDGLRRWDFEISSSPTEFTTLAYADATLYLDSWSGVHAIGVDRGAQQWTHTPGQDNTTPTIFTTRSGSSIYTVYWNADEGTSQVVRLDEMGEKTWSVSLDGSLISPLSIADQTIFGSILDSDNHHVSLSAIRETE